MGRRFGFAQYAKRQRSRCAVLQRLPTLLRSLARSALARSGRRVHQRHATSLHHHLRYARRHRSVDGRHLGTSFAGQHGWARLRLHHRRIVSKLALRRPILVRKRRLAQFVQTRYDHSNSLSFALLVWVRTMSFYKQTQQQRHKNNKTVPVVK